MKAPMLTPAQFDAALPQVTAMVDDWVDRECTSFDAAVQRSAGGADDGGGSIWDVPQIDSKRTVSLLTALEPLLGDKKLPATLVRRGGYSSADDLKADLLPKLRKHCTGSASSMPPSAEKATPATTSAAPAP